MAEDSQFTMKFMNPHPLKIDVVLIERTTLGYEGVRCGRNDNIKL